ncbi:MAG: hypothetical protein DRO15_05285 [Thermoprotei archaeon]|nr:MAG: hypothetical protein DRO15_05285 [Thermoprotei archaeon]
MSKLVGLCIALIVLITSGVFTYIHFERIENFILSAPRDLLWLSMLALGFIGASSVIVPIPYTGIIFIISSSIPEVNTIEIAVFVGIGSALGEITGWLMGFAMRKLVPKSYRGRAEAFLKFIRAKGVWALYLLLFIFAFTPLPDDAVFIALGILRFPIIKALIPCIVGKILAIYSIATLGKMFGEVLEETIGIAGTMILTLVLITSFIIIVFAINWEELLSKFIKTK